MIHPNTEQDEIQNLEEIAPSLQGSAVQSYVTNTIVATISRGIIGSFVPLTASMSSLHPALQGFLATSPLIPIMLIPIPLSWSIHRTGGKKEILIMNALSAFGMIGLTIITACIDPTTIDRFDWRYRLCFLSGLCIGAGSASFQLIIDTLKWIPKEHTISNAQNLYSLIVDASSVITPIFFYFTKVIGYSIPYSIYTMLGISSEILMLTLFYPSPYNQFKEHYSTEIAKKLALKEGEMEKFVGTYDTISLWELIKEGLCLLTDRRIILLSFSLMNSLGASWFNRLILPIVLIRGFRLSNTEAILASSLSYLATVLTRPLAFALIDKWDKKSGGVKIFLFGSSLTIISSLLLASVDLPQWALYTNLVIYNIGYGFNLVSPLNLAAYWSKPINSALKGFNPSTVFSIFGTLGTFGGILLSILFGLLADESNSGYQKFFFIMMTLNILISIGIPIVDYQVRTNNQEGIVKNPYSFFGRIRDVFLDKENTITLSDPEVSAQYVEKIV